MYVYPTDLNASGLGPLGANACTSAKHLSTRCRVEGLFFLGGEALYLDLLFSVEFSGTPKDMAPPYGKFPILFPYHSHKESLKIWE